MDKRFVAILAALVVIFGGIFIFTQHKSNNGSTNTNGKPTQHIEGKGTTGVTLVEYGDYECPVCQAYNPTVDQVAAFYGDRIKHQFRNLPLYPQPHPFALTAAKAAEAAGKQNKYWEMHTLLYQLNNWKVWTTSKDPTVEFDKYAQQLGLDMNKYHQDFGSTEINDAIQADINQFGKDFKASNGSYDPSKDEATPTFFLNGKYISNTQLSDDNGPSLAKFKQFIDAEIAKLAKKK